MTFSKECWPGYRHAQSRSWLCLEQGYRCQLATKRYQWGGIKIMFSLFLHDAACGRRRMSPSARHKLALCVRNPGFPGRKLVFPQRRSRRGNVIISFRGKEGRGEEGSSWLGSTGYQLIQQLFRRRKLLVVKGRVLLMCNFFRRRSRKWEMKVNWSINVKNEQWKFCRSKKYNWGMTEVFLCQSWAKHYGLLTLWWFRWNACVGDLSKTQEWKGSTLRRLQVETWQKR